MDYQIQVVTVPVTDVDQAAAFYTQQAGFALDVDYHRAGDFRVVQLTPPGSACSVQFGVGLTGAAPGSVRGTYLPSPTSRRPVVNSPDAASKSAPSGTSRPSTTGRAAGSRGPTRNAATTPASPSSPTWTATPGSSRRSATVA
jgi:catechol 2,3-dioxygenase-like lactoylglutathione lyase family enzyme